MSEEMYHSGECHLYGMPWSDPFDGPTFCDCEGKIHANRCGTTRVFKNRLGDNEALKETYRLQEITRRERIRGFSLASASSHLTIRTIDVYFHVVYSNAAGNVSNAKLQEQIDVLNRDFRKQNSDVPARWADRASDTHIQFKWDPGNVNRVSSPGILWSLFTQGEAMKFAAAGGSDVVTPNLFLNIWVCNLGDDLLGFALFPADGLLDPDFDGVVVQVDALPGGSAASYDLGRTLVHEVGHYLNLFHTWGDGDCTVDDGVLDTPESSGPSFGCQLSRDSCPSHADKDMVENYMDYSDDACLGLFTYGQGARMVDCLIQDRTGIWTVIVSGSGSGIISGTGSGFFTGFALSGSSGIISGNTGTGINWIDPNPAPSDPLNASQIFTNFVISSAATCPHTVAYSLKKDYFGEMSAWRNIETFTVEYLIKTTGPLTAPVFERIKADIVAEIVAAKSSARSDIRIISVDVPTSSDYLEGLVIFQKMTVVYEVKTLILNNVDFASASTYGTLHANYLAPHVSDIDAFNESFDLEKGDSGEYSYTHNVSFTAQNGTVLSAYAIAQVIGQGLLSSAEESSLTFLTYESQYNASLQVQNIYANARKTFSETYDTLKNTYSFTFTLKFRVGKDGGVNTYSYIEKYSLEMNELGISKVTQNLSILGASSFADASNGLATLQQSSFARCEVLYDGFKQHDGSLTYNGLTLYPGALSVSHSFLRPSLQIEYSITFTDDPMIVALGGRSYKQEESVDWSIDEKGVSNVDINVTLISYPARSGGNSVATDLSNLVSIGIVSSAEANPSEVSLATLFGNAYPALVNRASAQIALREFNGIYLEAFSKIRRSISIDQMKQGQSSGGNKNLSYKCSYTNDPVYNRRVCSRLFSLGGQGIIRKAEVKISTNLPSDSIKEYNIIGNKTILSYPFNMTEGSISIVINMILKRPVTSRLGSFQGGQYAALTNPIGYRDLIRQIITQVLIPDSKDVFIYEPRLAGASEGSLTFTGISFTYASDGEVSVTCEAKIKCKKSIAYLQNNRIGSIII